MDTLNYYYGIPYAYYIEESLLTTAVEYTPEDGDIFLATYPKCGTNWSHNIISLILRKGEPIPVYVGVADTFFEMVGADVIKKKPKPRFIPTHMMYSIIPKSPLAKYIVVYRNPKDACVSLFHHNHTQSLWGVGDPTFGEFLDIYLSGKVSYGDYFDHLMSWYPHKDDANVLFLTYESMKKDTRSAVMRIGQFLGKEHEDWLKNEENMRKVLDGSSLKQMHSNLVKGTNFVKENMDDILMDGSDQVMVKFITAYDIFKKSKDDKVFLEPICFVRKGEVGDWRNYFTKELSKRFEKKFWERTAGTDVADLWKDVDFLSEST